MPTLLATPEKVAIYTGGDDGPFNEPLRHLGRLKFHSQLAYLPFLPARTIIATISVPAGGVGFRRTIDLGAHGQPGVPFIYGTVAGTPMVGSVQIYNSPSTYNIIVWTLCVNGTSVFIQETRSTDLTFGVAPTTPRTVTVYVSSKLAA
jgi:hypothetical protein